MLFVRQTEKTAQDKKVALAPKKPETKKSSAGGINPEHMRLTQLLTRKYMTKVEVKGDKSGEIQIHFSSPEEMSRIVSTLLGDLR